MLMKGLAIFLRQLFFSCCFLTVPSLSCLAQEGISNYRQFFGTIRYQDKELLLLRSFEQNGKLNYLAADPQEMTTLLLPSQGLVVKNKGLAASLDEFKESPYMNAINAVRQRAAALQDAGIIHGFPKEKGVTLTIDLCPSHKALDRIIFTSLIAEFKKIEQPVPVAVSITGRWMLSHTDDLSWLKNLVKNGEITVTWVNHSYNHRVSASAPLKTNFLLEPGTDLNFEILGAELAMLQHGLLPSLFFRFPGLVSDQQVVDKLLTYGIIPVGSDAWLAKGQKAASGSIVLIHGNGNEPLGVKDFIKLLQTQQKAVTGKTWLMYDLRESVEEEFGQK
jgi:hypothetical protein